jgi:hypothetical protein
MLAHGTICTQPYSWDFNAKAQRRKDASEEWFLSQAGYGRYSQQAGLIRLHPLCAFASLRLCVNFISPD